MKPRYWVSTLLTNNGVFSARYYKAELIESVCADLDARYPAMELTFVMEENSAVGTAHNGTEDYILVNSIDAITDLSGGDR